MFQVIADGTPRVSSPWSETYTVEVSTTDDLFHTLKTMWGPTALRSDTDSTEQLVWCLHEVYVTCYFCYMLFNTHLYLHIILLRGLQVPMVLEYDYIPHT
jgi:hypothetical protein